MKRTQQCGWYIRGKVGARKEVKKAQTKAERIEAKRLLKKSPEEVDTRHRRRFFGYDD